MVSYLFLGKYGGKAIHAISGERTEKVMAIIKKLGGKITVAHALLGSFDCVIMAELPDAKSAMKASLAMSKATGIGFTTMPAIPVAEFDALATESNSLL